MAAELIIKIAGEAGQGMQTIGAVLCQIFKRSGLYVFANQDYMSRVRGGNNFFQVRVADIPIYALRQRSDITIALDKESVILHRQAIASGGIVIYDAKKFGISETGRDFFDAPYYELANSVSGSDIFINVVCCGIITGLTGIRFDTLSEVLKDTFSNKGQEIVNKNILSAKAGYDFSVANFSGQRFRVNLRPGQDTLLMNANDAIALGALQAGCKFFSAYPMTPSTGIMNTLAHFAGEFGVIVEQAEDEIAAVNMAIGASFAGARSMTATSGGGFALMGEGVSLAAMTETPVVLVDGQRPAPATGLPTRTEQADLDFILHAGHGEFARVVYSPGTIEEAFYLTIKAFNIADKYQIPVIIMTDQHLADSYRNIIPLDVNKVRPKSYSISKDDSFNITQYKRYAFTETGVSPRAIPSRIDDCIYVDSDEHSEEGHIIEDAPTRVKMVEKRLYKKMRGLISEIESVTAYNTEGAQIILVGFGSTYGVMKEAASVDMKARIGFVHLSQVWPFPVAEMVKLLKDAKRVVTVENNAGAQLARLIKRETGLEDIDSILKYDGRPFNLDILSERIKQLRKE